VRETTQALARTTAAHEDVFDAVSTQGFEFAHDLVWRADQAVRLRFLGRMTIGQDMRTSGTVRPARYRQNAFMELATTFEGGIFGGLAVGDIHVARKSNMHRIERAPTRCAFGLLTGSFAGGLYALAAFALMAAVVSALWLHIPRAA
jgi:hypothetical protein